MKLLLDTHLLIWVSEGQDRLSSRAIELISDTKNELYFSVASIWEIAIKTGLNRPDFKVDARLLRRSLIDNGYVELCISSEHAVSIDTLPAIHKDPFDRLLLAQAIVEGIILLTNDATLAKYQSQVRLV